MLQDVVLEFLQALAADDVASASGTVGLEGPTNQNTLAAYRNDLNQACAFLQRQQVQNWQDVTREQIAAYMLEMREQKAYRPATVARRLAALKALFRYLYATGLRADDPLEQLDAPRVQKDPPQTLTPEQMADLFAQIDTTQAAGKRDLAMFHLLYSTGMRVSELVSLELTDVDLERSQVVCPGQRGRSRRERTLPLSPTAQAALKLYLDDVRPSLVARHPEQVALFLNHHGVHLTRQGFWLIIKGYARQAGITDLTPHKLRHSFAVLMLREGMELRSVQELLGHVHISTTQIYSQALANN
jgi:integrase/recombinase XerD